MKKQGRRITTSLLLLGLLSTSFFGAYGLTSSNSGSQIDAIASASTSVPKSPPATTPKSTPKSIPKTTVKPVPPPVALPLPAPIPAVPAPVLPAFNGASLNLIVLGKFIDLSTAPIILTTEGKAMLPLRKLAEALGYSVRWDDSIKAAVLLSNADYVIVNTGNLNYIWGSKSHVFSKKPEIFNNSLYIPLDFITDNPAFKLVQANTSVSIDLAVTEFTPTPEPLISRQSFPQKSTDYDDEEDDD